MEAAAVEAAAAAAAPAPAPALHRPVLRRAGVVLIAAGLVQVAVSSFLARQQGVLAVLLTLPSLAAGAAAGVLMLKGNLRAASVVRWLMALALPVGLAMFAVTLFGQPFDLTLTQWRLFPGAVALNLAVQLLTLALCIFLLHQLGSTPVLAARDQAGRKRRDIRIPVAIGLILACSFGYAIYAMQRSTAAARAKKMAEQQLGPGFQYHVAQLHFTRSPEGSFVLAIVSAWNREEVRLLPLRWQEPNGN